MSNIKPEDIGAEIEQELTIYQQETTDALNKAGRKAMRKLVKLTKESAPRSEGEREHFADSITSVERDAGHGNKRFIWCVKAPNHRLTHLIVHGHATKNGGRTKANPFLQRAADVVLPEYEKTVEEVLKK